MLSTLLAFNTVERLLRGDFYHCTRPADVTRELPRFPADWLLIGLGTTNLLGRHGEVIVDGLAGAPRFGWIDPLDQNRLSALDADADLPFVAVAVADPTARRDVDIPIGAGLAAEIEAACIRANVGLAALDVHGPLDAAEHQVMCEIPAGGVRPDAPARAYRLATGRDAWRLTGFYSANPTIQTMIAHGTDAVHLHGRCVDGPGGHLNDAISGGVTVSIYPLPELVLRIRGLDVAWQPVLASNRSGAVGVQ